MAGVPDAAARVVSPAAGGVRLAEDGLVGNRHVGSGLGSTRRPVILHPFDELAEPLARRRCGVAG